MRGFVAMVEVTGDERRREVQITHIDYQTG